MSKQAKNEIKAARIVMSDQIRSIKHRTIYLNDTPIMSVGCHTFDTNIKLAQSLCDSKAFYMLLNKVGMYGVLSHGVSSGECIGNDLLACITTNGKPTILGLNVPESLTISMIYIRELKNLLLNHLESPA